MQTRSTVNPLPLPGAVFPEDPTWIGIVSRGIEEVAAAELRSIGAKEVEIFRSGVRFRADFETMCRIHLQVGSITRILYPFREFAAAHSRMLYDQVRRVPWEKFIRVTDTIAIECTASGQARNSPPHAERGPALPQPNEETGSRPRRLIGQVPQREGGARSLSTPPTRAEGFGHLPEPRGQESYEGGSGGDDGIRNTHYVSLKIKDAIVDRIREETGERPNVDTENPTFRVYAHLSHVDGARCVLSLDATGTSLHERGYRAHGALAPLRETLASAIISLTGWDATVPLLDPMCGSATLLIEAARKAMKIPNPSRMGRFAFMNWPGFDLGPWEKARATVGAQRLHGLRVPILGYDSSSKALGTAKQAARAGEVEDQIEFHQQELKGLIPPPGPGVLVTNPPYGERVGNPETLKDLYYLFGTVLREKFQGWTVYVLSGNAELTPHMGLKSSQKTPLFNGAIECRLLKYEMRVREPKLASSPTSE